MALLVVRPGTNTTLQDRGRVGYREFGVPVGGAFDRGSLDLANALLGNDPDDATLELTLVGGTYRAEAPLAIALAGAPMTALIRSISGPDRPITIPQSAKLHPGDELVIGGSPIGARAYLAVRGGWKTPLMLGSRSSETRLEAGERLPPYPARPWLAGRLRGRGSSLRKPSRSVSSMAPTPTHCWEGRGFWSLANTGSRASPTGWG